MARGYFADSLRYPSGTPAVNEDVTVVLRDTSTLASLFSAASGAVAMANPQYTDGLGNVDFFVEQGSYDLLVNGARIQIEITALPAGSGGEYVHNQLSPVATWSINHGRPGRPDVRLFLTADLTKEVFTDLSYQEGTILAEWSQAETGKAHVS